MMKSLVLTWLAIALSLWLGSAQETCTDCDVPEESVLLQTKAGDLGMPWWWYVIQENKNKRKSESSEVTWRCAPDVNAAQYAWKNLILGISQTYRDGGDFVKVAEDGIHELYGYDIGPVLFKPTKAKEVPFRGTAQGALSYFVGAENLESGGIPEDEGFAINGGDTWSKVRFDNDQIYCVTDTLAFAEGYYYFTNNKTGDTVGVEYSFGYQRIEGDKLKIILHHSSIPYSPPETMLMQESAMLKEKTAAKHLDAHGGCQGAIKSVQDEWKHLILSISSTYLDGGDFVQVAEDGIAHLYGYEIGQVLFKPTQAVEQPFRSTPQGAKSYFVGAEAAGNVDGIPEDKGFAIAAGDGWSKVEFDNDQIYCLGHIAIAEGYYYFTNKETKAVAAVEYSFGYEKIDHEWKIFLHHSSIPYSPPTP